MKKVFLSISIITLFFTSCEKAVNLPAPYYDMEGKWTYGANNSNTMYLYEDGLRYTYYCGIDNCDSLYNTYTAGDSNHIPEVLNYTFENDTLHVDLNFGNELVTLVTFECEGGQANFEMNGQTFYRLNSDCE